MQKIYLFILSVLFASCSSELVESGNDTFTVNINSIAPYDSETITGSRASIDNPANSNSCTMLYENGDGFGLFAEGGYQIPFFVSGYSSPSPSVSVVAKGWNTKPESKYATYYPYNNKVYNSNAIPFSYVGAKQNGNANASHMKDCMLYSSNSTNSVNNSFAFDVTHTGTTIRFQLTLDPNDANITYPVTFTRMAIVGPDATSFVTYGEFDLFSNPQAFKNTKTSRMRSIDLENFTISQQSELLFIFMSFAAPLELNGQYTAVLWDNQGNTYTGSGTWTVTLSRNTANRLRFTMAKNNAFKSTIEQYITEEAAAGGINVGN